MPSGSSSLADTPAAPTAACTARDTADVVRRLEELIQSIEDIAPLLSWATLQVAVNRLRSLADASGDDAHDVDNLAGSPLHPVQLSFTGMNVIECSSCSEPGDEHSVAGSFGSLDNGPAEAELGEDWEPLWDNWEPGGSPGDDPRAEAAGFGELAFDDRLWSGGPLLGDSIEAAAYAAAAAAAADNDDPNVGESPAQRDPRLPGPGRDALGLDRHGRRMYCDYHDLGGGDVHACAAVDMLQQRAISQLIAKLQRQRQRTPASYGNGREWRHPCYKAVVAWQWANPLGAENRVRLCRCVEHRILRLFPNPVCCDDAGAIRTDCDLLDQCEKAGHYTGFRTAEESRAIREGRFSGMDLR